MAAAKKYKQELEAAEVLQKQTDAAVSSRESFIAKETTKSHVRTLENNQKKIKEAVEQESAASKSFSVMPFLISLSSSNKAVRVAK